MDRLTEFLTKDIRDGLIDLHFGWIDKSTLGGLFNDDNGDTKIVFNVALMIADTFVHEMYHYHMPHLTEEEVLKKTQSLLNRMTVKQIKDIFVFAVEQEGGV